MKKREPPLNLFIDTCIFLSFYHFSKDDLEELKKLKLFIDKGKVILVLPEQVINEFNRRRDGIVAKSIAGLAKQHVSVQLPRFSEEFKENEELLDLLEKASKAQSALLAASKSAAEARALLADKVIDALFASATIVKLEDKTYERARKRNALGNPPGECGNLGDAVCWECLLSTVQQGENIHLVSVDHHYRSALNEAGFSPFLRAEWERLKSSKVLYYESLSELFKAKFPDIKLSDEDEREKDVLVRELQLSSSYSNSHAVIGKLGRFDDFSRKQANDILLAAITNDQVFWILTDPDVKDFLTALVETYEDELDPANLKAFRKRLANAEALAYLARCAEVKPSV